MYFVVLPRCLVLQNKFQSVVAGVIEVSCSGKDNDLGTRWTWTKILAHLSGPLIFCLENGNDTGRVGGLP